MRSKFAKVVWVLLALLFVAPNRSPAQSKSPKTLTTAAQVRTLSQAEAAKKIPVKIRGVVMDEARIGGFAIVIHDGEEGIYVSGPTELVTRFVLGDLIEVTGVSDPGGFAPIVVARQATKVGVAPIPPPRLVNFEDLISGELDAQWVEITGIVRSSDPIQEPQARSKMTLASGGEKLAIRIESKLASGDYVDARVRLRGICFNQHNANRQLVGPMIHVPRGVPIEVISPAPADPFGVEETQVASLLQFAPQGNYGHRVHVRGIVTHQVPGQGLWLRQGQRGLRVLTEQANVVAPGTEVSVVGFPNRGGYTPILEDASFKVLKNGTPVKPFTLNTISQGIDHDADLVELEAVLKEVKTFSRNGSLTVEYVLDWGGESLSALLNISRGVGYPDAMIAGSIVRITGISTVAYDESAPPYGLWRPQAFQILLRNSGDLKLVQPPPWWTLDRIVLLCAGIAGCSLIVALLATFFARRRLREQESRRALAEAEFAAILKERNRMAREIHDTLAQGLSAISMQLELAKKSDETVSERLLGHIETAHRFVRQSLAEARSSIWNMRSQVLENGDLASALSDVLRQLTEGSAIKGAFEKEGRPRRLAPVAETHLLRIGQEAITNAIKHAQPKLIQVRLVFSERQVVLTVADDGNGIDPTRQPPSDSGFGVVGMRERAAQLRGELKVESKPGQGTKVIVTLPVDS